MGGRIMDTREPMLDIFIFETFEMLEKLQELIIDSEKVNELETDAINEIFRIMHTIKGSSGMMMFDNISNLSHTIEDIFYFIRESKPDTIDYSDLQI
jgi:two-component system chemotaxis sensor kinase CheA